MTLFANSSYCLAPVLRFEAANLRETLPGRSISEFTRIGEFTRKKETIVADIAQYFVKDYEQKEFKELADAPVTAIEGLSEGDAEKLQQAFNVKTVRDLAENKFVRVAQAVVSLSR